MKKTLIVIALLLVLALLALCEVRGSSSSYANLTGKIVNGDSINNNLGSDNLKIVKRFAVLKSASNGAIVLGSESTPLLGSSYSFTKINPGEYIIKVWAENSNGDEIASETKNVSLRAGMHYKITSTIEYLEGEGDLSFEVKIPKTTKINRIKIESTTLELNEIIDTHLEDDEYKVFSFMFENILSKTHEISIYYQIDDLTIHTLALNYEIVILNKGIYSFEKIEKDDFSAMKVDFSFIDKNNKQTSRNGQVDTELLNTDKIVLSTTINSEASDIYYSIDNSEYSLYTLPIILNKTNAEIRAYAVKENGDKTPIITNSFLVKVKSPKVLNTDDALTYKDFVNFEKLEGITYHYVLKSGEINDEDIFIDLNDDSIQITEPNKTLYLRSEKAGFLDSSWTSFNYSLRLAKIRSATLDLSDNSLIVEFSHLDPTNTLNADIYYTTTTNMNERKLNDDRIITDYSQNDEIEVFLRKNNFLDSVKIKAMSQIGGNIDIEDSYEVEMKKDGFKIDEKHFSLKEDAIFGLSLYEINKDINVSVDSFSININGNVLEQDEQGKIFIVLDDNEIKQLTIRIVKGEEIETATLSLQKNVNDNLVIVFTNDFDIRYTLIDNPSLNLFATEDEFYSFIAKKQSHMINQVEVIRGFAIPSESFKNFSSLTKVILPSTIESIGFNAFENANCTIDYDNSADKWIASINKGLESISENEKYYSIANTPVPNLKDDVLYKVVFAYNNEIITAELVKENETINKNPKLPKLPNKFESVPAWLDGLNEFDINKTIVENLTINAGYISQESSILNIYTKDDLDRFRNEVNSGNTYEGKTIILKNNIDYQNEIILPIGVENAKFMGTFDGNYKRLSNINIQSAPYPVAFFGYIEDATIQNVKISSGSVINTSGAAASLVGNMINSTVIDCLNNAYVNAQVASGLVAEAISSFIKDCTNNSNIGSSETKIGAAILATSKTSLVFSNNKNEGEKILGRTVALIGKIEGEARLKTAFNNKDFYTVGSLDGVLNINNCLSKAPKATLASVINFENGASIENASNNYTFDNGAICIFNGDVFEKQYQNGQRGPSGGLIFNFVDGKYYEAAISDLVSLDYSNTLNNIQNLEIEGYSSWLLPSYNELELMYNNLHLKNLGRFENIEYWSSDKINEDNVTVLDFAAGTKKNVSISQERNSRPYRIFESPINFK